ncbi:DUF1049 domain-containing protein [Streptomyces sp. AJS327]|uniref:DUF1049 domain-containing protein n=1 Tax=Streptomyces sp. AJS327 TaxID=2545265 RepID=UPI0015DFCC34|nr:DUF1049 domain-containing protein [Streptomyces sp. AJS327]MBA0052189.1 DUF1049 domain-containing protein [Streptomyces sp. AJS327]
MNPRRSGSRIGVAERGDGGLLTPRRITVAVVTVLALIFVFENTGRTRIRLLIPEVTLPLWVALLGMGFIGWLCGALSLRRKR